MNETQLRKLALLITCIGLVALFFLSQSMELDETTLSEIDRTGDMVKVKGTVTNTYQTEKTTVLEIAQPATTKVVLIGTQQNVSAGTEVEIIGRVDEYNGEQQIVASRIRVVG